jgi:hypothetical protein
MNRLFYLLLPVLVAVFVIFLPPRALQADVVDGVEAGPIGLDALPDHARAVVLTFIGRARDGKPELLAQQLGVRNAGILQPEANFRYRGFGVREVVISDLSQDSKDPAEIHIAGQLRWKDLIGRRALSSFEAIYRVSEGGVTLEQAAWEPAFSVAPQVRAFTVPTSAAGSLEAAARSDFTSFFLAASELERTTKTQGDSLIAVFLMDRVGPETICDLKLSRDQTGTDGRDEIARARLYEPGWGVLGTSLKANAFSTADAAWLKVVCGKKSTGLFSSSTQAVVSAIPISAQR